MTDDNPSKLLTEKEAAKYLRVSPRTLQGWRYKRIGPEFVKLGDGTYSRVVYRLEDLEAFVARRVKRTTGEGSA